MKRLAIISAVLLLVGSSAWAQQPPPLRSLQPSATQLLGQQLGAVAANNAELIEQLNNVRAELADVKVKCGDRCEPPKEKPAGK